jgi:hypothetical protein
MLRASYGAFQRLPEASAAMETSMREVIAFAGVPTPENRLLFDMLRTIVQTYIYKVFNIILFVIP